MTYAIHYLLLLRECTLSIAVIEISTMPSATNRCLIVDILCLISVKMVFNRLSNVRLLLGIFTRPQANASCGCIDNLCKEKYAIRCWNPVETITSLQ
jgi:hypothetical protein